MRHNHHMRQLAILYFEGRATDEEELRLLEFIKESAQPVGGINLVRT